jgi:hypothetical protein
MRQPFHSSTTSEEVKDGTVSGLYFETAKKQRHAIRAIDVREGAIQHPLHELILGLYARTQSWTLRMTRS